MRLDCFHTTAKCEILILIRNAHFELKFERRYFQMRISNSNYALCCRVQTVFVCYECACKSN